MDALIQLIATYSSKEIKALCDHMEVAHNAILEKKLLHFILRNREATHMQLATLLYGKANMLAYFGVKKRLNKKVMEFALLMEMEADETRTAWIKGWSILANRALRHNNSKLAAHFLKKCREEASRGGHNALLNEILFAEIKHAEKLDLPMEEAIARCEESELKLALRHQMELARVRLRNDLAFAKREGLDPDAKSITARINGHLKLRTNEIAEPDAVCTLTSMQRSIFLSTRDYSKSEFFILQMYSRLKVLNAGGSSHLQSEIEFHYMLAHAFYRSLKFEEGKFWLGQMGGLMNLCAYGAYNHKLKFLSLKAAIGSYPGNNEEAIATLESALAEKCTDENLSERINMMLNLAVYYFNAGKYRLSNAMIIKLPSDDTLLNIHGREWVLKKNMIHMVVQYELGNDDIAVTMLKRIKKNYAAMLKKPPYEMWITFLTCTAKMLANRNILKSQEFQQQIRSAPAAVKGRSNPDIHCITFFSWLISKISGRNFYEVVLESVNGAWTKVDGKQNK
jgi:hypothetical protein